MAFGIGDELSVRVTASTGSFTRGMDNAQDSLNSVRNAGVTTSAALTVLQNRVDEARDEFSSLDRAISGANRSLTGLVAVGGAASSAMGTLALTAGSAGRAIASIGASALGSTALVVGLTAATTGLISTLLPLAAIAGTLTAGLGALAAAFGTVIGTGIIAFGKQRGQQNKERLQEVKSRIEALKELKNQQQGLSKQEQKRLKRAKETVENLQMRKEATATLTSAQHERLDTLKNQRESLIQQIRDTGELTQAEQQRLNTINERIGQLESLKSQTQTLTENEQMRLKNAKETIQALEEKKSQTRGLNEQEKKRLKQLKETRDELEDQTGVMGGLKSAMSDLMDELEPIIVEFGEQFVPLIEDAIDAIPNLVRNIFDAIGGLDEFASVLRDMGQQAFRVIPDIVANIFDLARRALPIFLSVTRSLSRFLANNIGPAFEGMVRVTRTLAPDFIALGKAFANAVPQLTKLGTKILQVAIPAFSGLLNLIDDIIEIGEGSSSLADFITTLINKAVTWFNEKGKPKLMNIAGGMLSTIEQIIDPSDDEGGEGIAILDALIDRIASILTGLANWISGGGKQKITNFVNKFFLSLATTLRGNKETLIGDILDPLITILTGVFDALVTALREDEAKQLSDALGDIAREALALMMGEAIRFVKSGGLNSLLVALGDALVNAFVGAAGDWLKRAFMASPIGFAVSAGVNVANQPTPEPGMTSGTQAPQGGNLPPSIQVEVTGDTEVVKDISAEVVEDRRRRTRRNQGRRPSP